MKSRRDSARRVSRIFVLVSAALAALVLGAAASASAGTLDQQQTSFNSSLSLTSAPAHSGAQTFTAGIGGGLDQADLNLLTVGTPPSTVTVEIRTTSAGIPTATVLATGTIPTSAIGTTGAFVPVTFATPAAVTAGTQYALVAYSPGSSGNAVAWSYDIAGNLYSGGKRFLNADLVPPGADWSESGTSDHAFKTYVVPTPPPPPGGGGSTPAPAPLAGPTGERTAALAKCQRKYKKALMQKRTQGALTLPVKQKLKKKLKKCKRAANQLPV
jgi:hypothetical protein